MQRHQSRTIAAFSMGAALALATLGTSNIAHATPPCLANTPCHNSIAEFAMMMGFGVDAFGFGAVVLIGNARALHSVSKPGAPWLAVGYVVGGYNLTLGATWSALALDSLRRFPDDTYAHMQLGLGVAHLVMAGTLFGVTGAANVKRRNAAEKNQAWSVVPGFIPAPGGGAFSLAGRW